MSGPYRKPWQSPARSACGSRAVSDGVMSALLSAGCTLAILACSGAAESDGRMACAIVGGGAVGAALALAIRSFGDCVDRC